MEGEERAEDLEASIHIAETKLEQKDAQLRQKDQDQAQLIDERDMLQLEL